MMPVDADGNRADIIMDPGSTISRLNIGRLYERYISASSRKAKKHVMDNIGDALETRNESVILDIFNKYVLAYVKIFGNEQYESYNSAYVNNEIDNIIEVLQEIIDEELYVYSNIEDEIKSFELVLLIEQTIFAPPYGPVTYRLDGVTHTTKDNVMIAPMYILLLNKLADSLLTTSSAKVNHWGLPIGVSKAEKHRLPHKNSPLRSIGETESRIYGSYGGRRFLAELLDRGASTDTHSLVYKHLLSCKKPTDVKQLINRVEHPYGSHKALEIINTLFQSVGMGIVYTKDKNRFVNPTDKKDKTIFDIDEAIIEVDDDIKEEA